MYFPVGLIAHGKIEPGLFIHDALIVGKCIKAGLSMVRAHAALTESAETHFRCRKMDDRIVDASAAESAPCSNFFRRRFTGRKQVKGQRVGHGVDIADHLIQTVKGEDWHNRSEDLLLHDSV